MLGSICRCTKVAAVGEPLTPEHYGRCATHSEGRVMSDPRTIKKYPNRRLYDTVESRYITLADIRRLVIEQVDFVVVDKKSQGDITRSILLQVIAEQEHGDEPLMSRDFLSQVIRSYGLASRGVVGDRLEQSLRGLAGQPPQRGSSQS